MTFKVLMLFLSVLGALVFPRRMHALERDSSHCSSRSGARSLRKSLRAEVEAPPSSHSGVTATGSSVHYGAIAARLELLRR
jgi:hypothetical protein